MKWSVKIFFDRELHRMHLRKSSLQNSSALVQTLFLQKSTEKSLLIPMRSIKSAQCYISRTISRRQKFFCKNRPIFGMIRDAEVRGGERMYLPYLTAVITAGLGLLPKAALEAWFFRDKESTKRTLFAWLFINLGISISFGLALLFN